jgi:hypothetical protein
MIVVQTPTPFILSGGKRPQVIGYSVSGRPIEVYIFGNGESQRMIVAGIHGGYEWNTIALADELITHIYENPEIIPSDVTLYILRNLNPDGDARDHGYDGRVNDHGVDLQLPHQLGGGMGSRWLLELRPYHGRYRSRLRT